MCKGSITAKSVIQAAIGATYDIGVSDHGLGAFHPQGKTSDDCVACVQNGTKMTFSNIPPDLQERFGIGQSAVGTFIDTGDNAHDQIRFENGADAVLCELANLGVTAYVGVLNATAPDAEEQDDQSTAQVLEDA